MDAFIPSDAGDTARRVFWILSLAIFTAMLGVGIIVPLLPIYAQQLGASGFWIGLIFSGLSLCRSLFSPLAGWLSDLWGRKPFIAMGLFLYWFLSLGYLAVNDVGGLVAVRVAQGVSSAMIIPLAFAYIGDIAPAKQEGQYVGSFSVSLFAGFGIGPLFGGLIMHRFGIKANFYLMSSLCLLAFLVVAALLPHQTPQERVSRLKPPRYSALLRSRRSWGLFLVRFSNAFSRGALMAFFPLIAYHQTVMTPWQIGVAISSNVLLASFLQAPFGRLADRWDRWGLVLGGSVSFALLMVMIPNCRSFPQFLCVCLMMGVAGGLALPATTAMAVEEGRLFGMGSSMGFLNLGMSFGLGIGPIVAGRTVDLTGLPNAFYLAAVVGLIGAFCFGGLARGGSSIESPSA
jgi:MFS family permease